MLRVPLIIRVPDSLKSRAVAPRRVGQIVRLVDVTPTVLDLLGLTTLPNNGEPHIDGVSLVDWMRGISQAAELEGYAESLYPARFGMSPLKTLRDGRFKLIGAPRPELYDLDRDPFEERNIHAERRMVADAMRRRLDQMSVDTAGSGTLAWAEELSPDARERLHALGYIGSQPLTASHTGDERPDPKDCIESVTREPSSEKAKDSVRTCRAEFRNSLRVRRENRDECWDSDQHLAPLMFLPKEEPCRREFCPSLCCWRWSSHLLLPWKPMATMPM